MPLRADWESVKDSIMQRAVLRKFETHPEIREILLSTGDEDIVENAPGDYYWGCGTDGSGQILDELASYYLEARVLHFDRNYGQTSAFDAGFHQAGGDLIATLDGDLQYDPADILTLLPLAEHYDLVCGWRKDRHDTLVKRLSSRIANAIRNAVIHDGVRDTGCSLKVFRRQVVERIPLFEGMHRFFPALARMHGFTVTEVPVRHYPRAHGRSKYGIGNRVFKALRDLLAVRWMQRRRLQYRYRDSTLHEHETVKR